MKSSEPWRRYAPGYRARELQQIAAWIRAGVSGSIVGLPGAGKSNLFRFMAQHVERVQAHVGSAPGSKVVVVSVDLNNLADGQLSTLYRLILRGLYEARMQFGTELAAFIESLFANHKSVNDFFVLQSALRDLLYNGRLCGRRVVLLLDQFDTFCETAAPSMTNTLRGLRDSYKDSLCFVVGLQQALAYLPAHTALGELYELLDLHTLWLGPMNQADSVQMMAQEAVRFGRKPPQSGAMVRLWQLSGGFPAVLKAACHWWNGQQSLPLLPDWVDALLAQPSMQFRLQELWRGLDQEEQAALFAVANGRSPDAEIAQRLALKGVCGRAANGLQVTGELLCKYVQTVAVPGRGRLWLDEKTGDIYQGNDIVRDLSPLAWAVLEYLLQHPRVRMTKTIIIEHTWPSGSLREGITDDSLYQVIAAIRKVIEPDPACPHYLLTWRGQPEGGYQLFPEGRPG